MNSRPSQEEAAKILQKRRKARKSLIGFTEYTYPRYEPAEHHIILAEKLEAVARGEIDRLIVVMPPRHGKSELVSRRFPAWYLGSSPSKSIIAASYNSELAGDFGREVRNIVASREYRALFPSVRLAADSQAANRWHTDAGGAYVAAGVGTAITGRGGYILLIDDPYKDKEEADSDLNRKRVWSWYLSTAYTRLETDLGDIKEGAQGAIVIVQTRWRDDDLVGTLLEEAEQGGEEWEVVEFPALSDKGQALWPEKYDIERLATTRRTIGERNWSALYQQRPSPEECALFKREWFRWYNEKPKELRTFGASDFAVTDDGGDFTVHGVVGLDADDNLYILDWWRGQTAPDIWIEVMLDLASVWKPTAWAVEKGQIEKSIEPFLKKRMRERRIYLYLQKFASTRDKATRAQAIIGRIAMGKVYLPKHASWSEELLSILLRFPYGKADDDVDVLSLFGRMLDSMRGAGVSSSKKKPKEDRWVRAEARQKRRLGGGLTAWSA
ncbi:MAG: phage terminase large subunit [Proteobacteria bacterium]|nr:phage terminase large subunit [Pseudomonadota bacterium]